MSKTLHSRFIWADLIRTLAIFLVILAHSIGLSTTDFLSFPLASSVAATCVPLFVLLSGALLLGKQEGYKLFYKKRLLRLMFPWLTWTFIYFIITFLQKPISFFDTLKLFSSTFTSFWFLPMIAAIYIITPALRILVTNSKPKDLAFLILLWFLAISVLPFYKNSMAFPLFVDDGLVRQTFSYLGFYLAGFWLTQINLPSKKNLLLLFILGIVSTISFYYFRLRIDAEHAHLAFDYIAPGVVLSSISFFALIYKFENKLQGFGTKFKLLIASLSRASLGIYFIHGLISLYFIKLFGIPYTVNLPLASAWVNALILFTMSYVVIWGLTKITWLKRFTS